jgi:hypothetical protein
MLDREGKRPRTVPCGIAKAKLRQNRTLDHSGRIDKVMLGKSTPLNRTSARVWMETKGGSTLCLHLMKRDVLTAAEGENDIATVIEANKHAQRRLCLIMVAVLALAF